MSTKTLERIKISDDGKYSVTYNANINYTSDANNYFDTVTSTVTLNDKVIKESKSQAAFNNAIIEKTIHGSTDLSAQGNFVKLFPKVSHNEVKSQMPKMSHDYRSTSKVIDNTNTDIKSPLPIPKDPINNTNPFCKEPPLLDAKKQFEINRFRNKLVNLLDPKYIAKRADNEAVYKGSSYDYKISIAPGTHDFGLVDPETRAPLNTKTPIWGFADSGVAPPVLAAARPESKGDMSSIHKNNESKVSSDVLRASSLDAKGAYIGPTFKEIKGKAIKVLWENRLVNDDGSPIVKHMLPVDTSIHRAMPKVGIPTVVHLHGSFSFANYGSDGHPEAWFTPNFAETGSQFVSKIYEYLNDQEACSLWYHDHTLGYTRLNVYTGLIGNYFISDEIEQKLIRENKIPSYPYEYPITIQDKKFYADGTLFYPATDEGVPIGAPYPSVVSDLFGDVIVINGKVWPYLKVEPRMYRFRFLNGSQSRWYNLFLRIDSFSEEAKLGKFIQIGTESGFLESPKVLTKFLFGGGMRQDIVIDFSKYEHGTRIYLCNDAPLPFPNGDPDGTPDTVKVLMKFKVCKPLNKEFPIIKLPKRLIPPRAENKILDLGKDLVKKRQVLVMGSTDQYGRFLPLLGTPSIGGLLYTSPITEIVQLGNTEEWEIYNITGASHPIHLHAVHFFVKNRQYFYGNRNEETGAVTNIVLDPTVYPPLPYEGGPMDTVFSPPRIFPLSETFEKVNRTPCGTLKCERNMLRTTSTIPRVPPDEIKVDGKVLPLAGMITRISMKFTKFGLFVWHCHILEHEDADMMRPLLIKPSSLIVPITKTFSIKAKKGDVLKWKAESTLPKEVSNEIFSLRDKNLVISKI